MPNTLGHIGVQGFLSRAAAPRADLRWALAGCVIPDLPWIIQRVVKSMTTAFDAYDLMLYAVAQSSLASCLLLCAACALLTPAPGRVFALLASNALAHLLLDACQIKLGNGVHLFAPFDWELLSFGWFWPESWPTYLMTISGVVFLAWVWRRGAETGPLFAWHPSRWGQAAVLAAAWWILPLVFLAGPESTDSRSVATLREPASRAGKVVAFDRARYLRRDGRDILHSFDEDFELTSLPAEPPVDERPAKISIRGRFRDPSTLEILESRFHVFPRDVPSYLGLFAVAWVWLRGRRTASQGTSHRRFPGPPRKNES